MGKVSNPYSFEAVDNYKSYVNISKYNYDGVYGPVPDDNGIVNLKDYYDNYIQNYWKITEFPEENLRYLNSGIKASSLENLFYHLEKVQEIPKLTIDTSITTNMSYVFSLCYVVTKLDISNFITTNVTNMHGMFYRCRQITELNVSHLNTSKVTDMSGMFSGCNSLIALDVSNFDTSKVTTMNAMFVDMYEIKTLDLSNFNTPNLINTTYMFSGCENLANLNLSGLNTSKVTKMTGMFERCFDLINVTGTLDLSKCTNIDRMFHDCNLNAHIHLKNVPRALNFSMSSYGIEGQHYIIDNYID